MPDCLFCSIVAGTAPGVVIGETERALALMNANPATFGHTLVIPRAHARDIWDLTPADGSAVWDLTQRVATAARDALSPDGLTLFQANRPAGWQHVFHFHMHVVPRWEGDDLRPSWTRTKGDPAKIDEAASLLGISLGHQAE